MTARGARQAVTLLAVALVAGAVVALLLPRASGERDLERQTRQVAASLRCPTCSGESAADSSAPLAQAMRRQIGTRLAAGQDADEIRRWFAERYGPGVLLDPPREGVGWVLVALPVAGLVAAGVTLGVVVRRRSTAPAAPPTEAERRRAAELVEALVAGRLVLGESAGQERLEAVLRRLAELERRGRGGPGEAATLVREAVLASEPQTATGGGARPLGTARPLMVPTAVLAVGLVLVGAVALAAAPRALVGASPGAAGAAPVAADKAGSLLAAARELERQGRLDEAGDAYRQALGHRPDDTAVAFRLAFALVRTGRGPEAEPFLRQVLAASPDHPEALLLLGTVLREAGDPAAVGLLRRFVEVAPGHPAHERGRELLEEAA